MSVKKALQFYNELSDQQKRFVDSKTMSATFPVSKWQGFMAKAVAFDTYGDKARTKMLTFSVLSFVIAFIMIFVALGSETFWLLGGTVLGVLVGIYFIIRRKKFQGMDLNNYLRLFFFPLLDVFKMKAGEHAKMEAQLDFRDPSKVQERKKYKENNRNFQQYAQQHIMARTVLKDGAQIEFIVSDDIREVSFWKTSASGKRKHKKKHKIKHLFYIKLSAPKTEYRLNNSIPEGISVEDREEVIIVKVKGKAKSDIQSHVLAMNNFLEGIQRAYACLIDINNKWGNVPDREGSEEEWEDDDMDDVGMVIWTGAYFDQYDYDSFESEGGYAYDYSDSDSFFDS